MELQATQEIRVFIDKKTYGQTDIEKTVIGYIPKERRENVSWKGCYYTIKVGEKFRFDRSNDWDVCYFVLENKAEFEIDCSKPSWFIENHKVRILGNFKTI